jgi:hypothetical protein
MDLLSLDADELPEDVERSCDLLEAFCGRLKPRLHACPKDTDTQAMYAAMESLPGLVRECAKLEMALALKTDMLETPKDETALMAIRAEVLEASSRLETAERDLSTLELEAQELQAKRTALAQHAIFRAKQAPDAKAQKKGAALKARR